MSTRATGEIQAKGSDAPINSTTARKSQFCANRVRDRFAVAKGTGKLGWLTTS